jgi:hypothetical protein
LSPRRPPRSPSPRRRKPRRSSSLKPYPDRSASAHAHVTTRAADTWSGGRYLGLCGVPWHQRLSGPLSSYARPARRPRGRRCPGQPGSSVLVQIQAAGNHAGQLTDEELAVIIAWIESGAPEQ